MSASPRPGASWLGQNYDKLALATVLLAPCWLQPCCWCCQDYRRRSKSSVEDPSFQPAAGQGGGR